MYVEAPKCCLRPAACKTKNVIICRIPMTNTYRWSSWSRPGGARTLGQLLARVQAQCWRSHIARQGQFWHLLLGVCASGPSLLSSYRSHEIRNSCNMAIPAKRVEIALDEEKGEDETSAEKEHHEMEMKRARRRRQLQKTPFERSSTRPWRGSRERRKPWRRRKSFRTPRKADCAGATEGMRSTSEAVESARQRVGPTADLATNMETLDQVFQ